MITCRYVGGESSQIGEREFEAVGEKAVFSEEGFRDAVLGGAAFLPEQDFARLGFPEDMLEKYGPSGLRVDPPSEFNEKLAMGQQRYRDLVSRMAYESQTVLNEASDLK